MAKTLKSFDGRLAAAEDRLRKVRRRLAAVDYDLNADGFDQEAYYRDLIDAETEVAAVFAEARTVVRAGSVAWSALYDAEKVHADYADELRRRLTRHESVAAGSMSKRVA
ncbi:hypothetical protein [Saccharothrix deserti]|uniref:hypothetical protein n=1 Tax=Saccharothrix deserti TaxID=2593674 RepID=UPI00131B386D|nr:hypothetical protein [Saccharothrix deserti]